MAPAATDVPGRYDVVVSLSNGSTYGFMLADEVEPNLPFRSHKAVYNITPTFLDRSNVSGSYGDNKQDFFLTDSQHDWSLGEQQRYFVGTDTSGVSQRRYWAGSNVDASTPGQIGMQKAVSTLTLTSNSGSLTAMGGDHSDFYAATATNLVKIAADGTISTVGAHGAGDTPCQYGLASDGSNIYISGGSGNKIIKYNLSAFSTFSSVTGSQAIAYLNNALYVATGAGSAGTNLADTLQVLDTSGSPTSLFTWKSADGTVRSTLTQLIPYGGKLLVLRYTGTDSPGGELWLYDGTGVSKLIKFPNNFYAYSATVVGGIVLVAGTLVTANRTLFRPAVFFYVNGSPGLLWKANAPSTNLSHPTVTTFQDGAVIADESTGSYLFYDPAAGGVTTIGSFTTGTVSQTQALVAGQSSFAMVRGGTTAYLFPAASTTATTTTVTSSLFDFDNTLTKFFRGIKVDWVAGTDGNGGSVDVAYQIDSVDGSYTSLANSVASGAETSLTGVTGRAISVKATLNKGTSTAGPILKRVYLRAAPQLQQYRSRQYIFHCYGPYGAVSGVRLRDGTFHPKSGFQMAKDLNTIASQTTPFSIIDKFGAITQAVVDLNASDGFDIFEERSELDNDPNNPGTFAVRFTIREV